MTAKLVLLAAASLLTAASANVSLSPEKSSLLTLQALMQKAPNPADIAPADMEKVVENLVMGGADFAATPMGGSVGTIRKLLESTMIPKVLKAHVTDQKELNQLMKDVVQCGTAKKTGLSAALKKKHKYEKVSPIHKICRGLEAVMATERRSCWKTLEDKKAIKKLKCGEFAIVAKKVGDENANKQIMKKGGSESVETYVTRISATVCGSRLVSRKGTKRRPGSRFGHKPGLYEIFMKAKKICSKATDQVAIMLKECRARDKKYFGKKRECDNVQDRMDNNACQRAVLVKDSCEAYSECFSSKLEAYETAKNLVQKEERDRKGEWRALKRMGCLIGSFADGKVEGNEITKCKGKTWSTNHLIINYPSEPERTECQVPDLYPATPEYKQKEFIPLPALAKGKVSSECVGVMEISTKPKHGSPKSCKCDRVTLNGPYSAGPMVKCTKCLDVRRSQSKNSCPDGTKIFSPRSRSDWKTLLASASPLRNPHWIIDVTRPQNGCGGCTAHAMNAKVKQQKSWRTSDGSQWWLRSSRYSEPNGDYHANCFLDLWHAPKNENSVTFNDGSCGYHSKSYYCQPIILSTTPKKGSPKSCKCDKVALTGPYKAGALLRCSQCLDVSRSKQKNSCPMGTKIFAPATREDWGTVIESTKPLRSPHWIIDVTRPQNGCGGCTRHNMNSKTASQATWRTQDGAAWWLRSTRYSEPNGDYRANCYLDLWRVPSNPDTVTFNDGSCNYHSNSYYCQPKQRRHR